jgi:hypothetical protein
MRIVIPRSTTPADIDGPFIRALSAAGNIRGYARGAQRRAAEAARDPRYPAWQVQQYSDEAATLDATAARLEAEAIGWASR